MAFLLSTKVFIDILRPEHEDNPAIRWKRTVRNDEVFVSVISIGLLIDSINKIPYSRISERESYMQRLEEDVPNIFYKRILLVDNRVAKEWGNIRQFQTSDGCYIKTEEALLIATARVNGYTYIAKHESYHDELGIHVIDPNEDIQK